VDIAERRVLSAATLESAWTLYTRAMTELRTVAVQRHVMRRGEFDAVMGDPRVAKFVASDGDATVTALATVTVQLEAMPLISPEYFEYHWPELFRTHRIYYLGFFAIEPDRRGGALFHEVIATMWDQVVAVGGIAVLDMSRRNVDLGLARAIQQTLTGLTPGTAATRLDEQSYWMYEPPAPGTAPAPVG
jgi:hypothetical protein